MINNFTTSNIDNLKGFIAELVFEFHFLKLNYNVIPLGNEKISGLLPSIDALFSNQMVEEGTYDSNTFTTLKPLYNTCPILQYGNLHFQTKVQMQSKPLHVTN